MLELTHDEVFSSRLIAEHFRKTTLERYWREHQERRHNHAHLFWTLLNLSLWDRRLLSWPRPLQAPLPSGVARNPSSVPTRAAASR